MTIEFIEEGHSYLLDDEPVDSVTTILKEEGYIDGRWFNREATSRGSLIHEATEALDRGTLTMNDFADDEDFAEILPYLKAWEKFKEDSGYTPVKIEYLVGDRDFGYAGTVDRIMETPKGELILTDIKSGEHSLWHGLQLAAYRQAFLDTEGYDVSKSRVVHLKKTGKYSICAKDNELGSYDNLEWEKLWRLILNARDARKRYGVG